METELTVFLSMIVGVALGIYIMYDQYATYYKHYKEIAKKYFEIVDKVERKNSLNGHPVYKFNGINDSIKIFE